jgi:hypothetical protein
MEWMVWMDRKEWMVRTVWANGMDWSKWVERAIRKIWLQWAKWTIGTVGMDGN